MSGRVATGPTEVAGTAAGLRQALRTVGVDVDVALWSPAPSEYPSGRVLSRRERVAFALTAPLRFEVLHYQYGSTWGRFADAWWARACGRTLVVRYHGDDCRLYSVARQLFPTRARVVAPADEPRVRRRLSRLGRVCHAALVADLELATYVRPFFRRVYVTPLSVLRLADGADAAQARSDRPVVLHAATAPDVKGTATITAAVEAVARRVPLEYTLLLRQPHCRVREELTNSDVVIDQLNSVTSGVFGLEALAAGVPVLGEFDTGALAPYQRKLPVVAVTPESLEDELESLLRDPERRARLGAQGREYVGRVYAPERIGRTMLTVYAHARTSRPGVYHATPDTVELLE